MKIMLQIAMNAFWTLVSKWWNITGLSCSIFLFKVPELGWVNSVTASMVAISLGIISVLTAIYKHRHKVKLQRIEVNEKRQLSLMRIEKQKQIDAIEIEDKKKELDEN